MRSNFLSASRRALLGIAFALLAGCASSPGPAPSDSKIEVAFSPEAGSEALVLKVIDSARGSIRLAGYSFTSPSVVRALTDAKRRGVDVRVLIDDKGNHGKANIAAMNLLVGADIPTRVISTYAIHHDKYIVVDGKHTQTGSFNYSQAAAKSNSENVLVVWSNPKLAATYLAHWETRWAQGMAIEMTY
ncbi:phospholipase D family protein [Variovorax sp. J22P240]|uniref:phospholipase D family nuclease n=1 Tax=Variovorax sp. J22P240 TaxID=3053514 RepID=UPI00257705A6|nr:phospholipase D family protein [Variovorax sp. J22P240]MDM0000576.1 phospholipase D family protein [Variovorax sp. J22P240]